jgi:hypothetical protein
MNDTLKVLNESIFGSDSDGEDWEIMPDTYDFSRVPNTSGYLEGFILDNRHQWLYICENPATDNLVLVK